MDHRTTVCAIQVTATVRFRSVTTQSTDLSSVCSRVELQRAFCTFIGIDLGGARGKTTAVARLSRLADSADRTSPHIHGATVEIIVEEVGNRWRETEPWLDDALLEYIADSGPNTVIAINAPLTVPACLRCPRPVCPGKDACEEPATLWLQDKGQQLAMQAFERDLDRIASVPGGATSGLGRASVTRTRSRIEPYVHRACELVMHYQRRLLPRDNMGQATGPIAARANHLRRRLAEMGFQLDRNLLEVSARSTVHALFGARAARGYRRDADPWCIRASIVEGLTQLQFSSSSRMAREQVLRSDHCFDALMSGYTAYLWARDGWTRPDSDVFATDGWIWAP